MATVTSEEQGVAKVKERRTARAEAVVDGERWEVELDGPHLGPMVLIYRAGPISTLTLWGTAVWLDDRIQYTTRAVIDAVAVALGKALLEALAARGAVS